MAAVRTADPLRTAPAAAPGRRHVDDIDGLVVTTTDAHRASGADALDLDDVGDMFDGLIPQPPTIAFPEQFRDNEDLGNLWVDFKTTGCNDSRNRLVLHYAPLVKFVAGRMNLSLSAALDHEDLVSYGLFGLMTAIDRFDLDRGWKFETFAMQRIRGSILDELRSQDILPRSVRSRIKAIERATAALETEFNRTPTEDEVADRVGLPIAEVRNAMSIYAATYIGTLDEHQAGASGGDDGSAVTVAERLTNPNDPLPDETLEDDEVRVRLAAKIRALGERERAVVALYYFEGLTLGEIGRVLGVTESRVCQLHTRALKHLRADAHLFAVTDEPGPPPQPEPTKRRRRATAALQDAALPA